MRFTCPQINAPPAPGRFSTIICCLYFAANTCACRRAVMSDSPPGANGMMYWIGLSGNAAAPAATRTEASTAVQRTRLSRDMNRSSPSEEWPGLYYPAGGLEVGSQSSCGAVSLPAQARKGGAQG